ncbi:MAG: terminase gpA endonuclease subunit, partial [Patescibacteria group bacterium]
FATKGMAGAGDLWPRQSSKISSKVPLWPLRVDAGKAQIYGRLAIVEPGPGYIHLPVTMSVDGAKSLTAEKQELVTNKKGFTASVWKKKHAGARNEWLDCAVGAYAALCGLRAMGFDLEAEVARLPGRLIFEPNRPVDPGSAPVPSGPARRVSGDSSWLGDTRGWLWR